MISEARRKEFESVRRAVITWAERDEAIVAVLLVGSWARDAATMASDVDVVVIGETDRFINDADRFINDADRFIDDADRFIDDADGSQAEPDWIEPVLGPGSRLVRSADWGAVIERRAKLPSGCEVEFGFAQTSWAAVDPVDAGTRRVVTDGCRIWYDSTGLLSRLLAATND